MTASCESPVRTYERFTVTYTLLNNLQDFLAVRLVWTPEHAQAGRWLPGLTLSRRRGGEGKQSQRWVTVAGCFGSEPGWSPWCHNGEFREAAGQSDFKGLDTGAGLPGMFNLYLFHFLAV